MTSRSAAALFALACSAERAAPPETTALADCDRFVVDGDARSASGARWRYVSTDDGVDYRLSGTLHVPQGAGPFPALVENHGTGGTLQGDNAALVASTARSWRMVVIAVVLSHARDDRDADGVVHAPLCPLGACDPMASDACAGRCFGASPENVLRAHKARDLLSCLDETVGATVDLQRVATHGHSRGASLTIELAGTYPDDFRAASHTSGAVTVAGADPDRTADAHHDTAARIRAPYQIHHGPGDEAYPFVNAERLRDLLAQTGVEHELHDDYEYPSNVHGQTSSDPRMFERMRAWYVRHGVLPSSSTMTKPQEACDGFAWSNPPGGALPPGTTHRTFRSASMGVDVGYNIYLPPGHDAGDRRYPVVYVLHGIGGDESVMPRTVVPLWLDAVARGLVPEAILVFVNGAVDSFYADSPPGDGARRVETSVVHELVPHVDATYPTAPCRTQRMIAGFSMGGFGALLYAMKHPDRFGAVLAHAPALIDWETLTRRHPAVAACMFDDDEARWDAFHPATYARQHRDVIAASLPVRIAVGEADGLVVEDRAFHELLESLAIPHELSVIPTASSSAGCPHANGFGCAWRHDDASARFLGAAFAACAAADDVDDDEVGGCAVGGNPGGLGVAAFAALLAAVTRRSIRRARSAAPAACRRRASAPAPRAPAGTCSPTAAPAPRAAAACSRRTP